MPTQPPLACRTGTLGLPYDTFVGLARFTGTGREDDIVMIVAETDDGLRPHRFLHFSAGTPARPTSLLNLRRIGYDGGGDTISCLSTSKGGKVRTPRPNGISAAWRCCWGCSPTSASHMHRIEAPTSLNRARRARGRPPIPACWKIDATSWVTKMSGLAGRRRRESRGGHHRSPVAHDRRGHQRRLRSGKTTWVRSSRVGEILKHLTRHRAFYELAKGDGQ